MKLSIITINYNNCEGLRKTIDSVVAQTWQEFEWIIVDGGSTDGSRELIEETAARLQSEGWPVEHFSLLGFTAEDWKAYPDPPEGKENVDSVSNEKVLKWCSEPDKGIYNAMNKGIVKAQGEYLNFMNSGDKFATPTILSEIFEIEHTADILYGFMMRRNIDGEVQNPKIMKKTISWTDLYYSTFGHQSTFTRKKLLAELNMYDESYRMLSDWHFFVKAIVWKGASYMFIPKKISIYECDGISSSPTWVNELERIREELFPSLMVKEYFDNTRSFIEVTRIPFLRFLFFLLHKCAVFYQYKIGKLL